MSQMNKASGPVPTVDASSLSASIDRAIAAIDPGRRGKLLVQWDSRAAEMALMVRGLDGKVELVGKLIKPAGEKLGWQVQGAFNFFVEPQRDRLQILEAVGLFRDTGRDTLHSFLAAGGLMAGKVVEL